MELLGEDEDRELMGSGSCSIELDKNSSWFVQSEKAYLLLTTVTVVLVLVVVEVAVSVRGLRWACALQELKTTKRSTVKIIWRLFIMVKSNLVLKKIKGKNVTKVIHFQIPAENTFLSNLLGYT